MQCIESFQKNDLKAVKEYDAEFHRFIIHTTKNSRIEATIRNLIKLSKCIVVKSDDSLSSQDIDALRQFLNALRDSNESLAEELMRKRVAASKSIISIGIIWENIINIFNIISKARDS